MKPATRVLLESADDTIGFEVPRNDWATFPWQELTSDISAIQSEIRTDLGLSLEADGSVQDASFIEELRILSPVSHRPNGVTIHIPDIAIRFSNFGRLFTLYSATDSLARYPVERILNIIENHRWRYVDSNELDLPYDGKNEALRQANTSWWVRFFDYV